VPSLVLASRSPQRRALLEQLGLEFDVVVPEVEELEAAPVDSAAVENARRKATAVAAQRPDGLVLGVDTMVALGHEIYGKPMHSDQARETLRALSGRAHAVISGVCLVHGEHVRTAIARTMVRFRYLDEPLIDWYLASGEWRERAGGYAIQGRGAALVAGIEGDYTNVVGLPVTTLLELAPELL
jgi:nucleoside triphosphate pyrophosphatase